MIYCHPIYSGRQTCGRTSRGHTEFLHLPYAVLALIFVARRIQPSLSLVDREARICVPTINRSSLAPRFELTSQRQKVSRLPTEPPGRPALILFVGGAVCVCCHPIYHGRQVCGRTSRSHRGFLHLPCAVLALIFFARRIQPFLSLVDREVELCVTNGLELIVLHMFDFFFLCEENSQFV